MRTVTAISQPVSKHGRGTHLAHAAHGDDVDATCRALVRELGAAGWLKYGVGGTAYGGHGDTIDTRAVCLLRETLAKHSGLADFALAMQGLGSGAISLGGTHEQKQRYLPRVANGTAIAAFALSEPEAGSDVAAHGIVRTRRGRRAYVLDGEKTWISNGGIADFYVVFARTGEAPGARGISAFIVDADTPGLEIAERIDVIAPHPLARLRFAGARVPRSQMLGEPGEGFKLAMRTLDIFRTSVAAASLGFRASCDGGRSRARSIAQDVRPDARRFPVDAGKARTNGADHRQQRFAGLSRGMVARSGRKRHARSGDGQVAR